MDLHAFNTSETIWRIMPLLVARLLGAAGTLMVEPYLVLRLTGEFGLSAVAAVALAGLVVVGGRLFAQPFGRLADRWPDLRLARGATVVAASSCALLATRGDWRIALLACGGLCVAGAAFWVVLRAELLRRVGKHESTFCFSLLSASFNLGTFAGGAMAGVMLARDAAAWLLAIACALHVAAAVALSLRSVTMPPDEPSRPCEPAIEHGISRPGVRSRMPLQPFLWSSALVGYLTTTVILVLAIDCARRLHDDAYTAVFFCTQAVALGALLPVAGSAMRAFTPRHLANAYFYGVLAAASGCAAFGAIPPSRAGLAVGALALGFAISQMLALPSLDPLLGRVVVRQHVGQALGATTTAMGWGSLAACVLDAVALESLPVTLYGWIWLLPGALGAAVGATAMRSALRRLVDSPAPLRAAPPR